MKTVSQCQKQITELTGKLDIVATSISEKNAELESLKQSNTKLLESSIGNKRMPKSLEVQRRNIFEKTQEIGQHESVKKSLEHKLSEARQEMDIASGEMIRQTLLGDHVGAWDLAVCRKNAPE